MGMQGTGNATHDKMARLWMRMKVVLQDAEDDDRRMGVKGDHAVASRPRRNENSGGSTEEELRSGQCRQIGEETG